MGELGLCPRCVTNAEWNNSGFYVEQPTLDDIKSPRKFGVEIETHRCDDHINVRGDTVFGCKRDGSIDGMEFVSPVLYGDEGLDEVRKICGHARRLNWRINSSCGIHLHLDLSDESNDSCFKVALAYGATYDFWTSFISNARKRNYYCAPTKYTPADIVGKDDFHDWAHWASQGDRYWWCNWYAYTKQKTVEIRHHAASLNPTKLCNWIKAHTRFIDGAIASSRSDIIRGLEGRNRFDQFELIAQWWDDEELEEFYRGRAAEFQKPFRRLAVSETV
jgi:hypothetical protein